MESRGPDVFEVKAALLYPDASQIGRLRSGIQLRISSDGRVTSQATGWRSASAVTASVASSGSTSGPPRIAPLGTAFLRSMVKRGLRGVRLIASDAHEGLKQAIATVLSGATGQRCRVYFIRNLLATVPLSAREAIAAIVRTIFAQPDHTRIGVADDRAARRLINKSGVPRSRRRCSATLRCSSGGLVSLTWP